MISCRRATYYDKTKIALWYDRGKPLTWRMSAISVDGPHRLVCYFTQPPLLYRARLKGGPRFSEFCYCSCWSLLPCFACSIRSTWVEPCILLLRLFPSTCRVNLRCTFLALHTRRQFGSCGEYLCKILQSSKNFPSRGLNSRPSAMEENLAHEIDPHEPNCHGVKFEGNIVHWLRPYRNTSMEVCHRCRRMKHRCRWWSRPWWRCSKLTRWVTTRSSRTRLPWRLGHISISETSHIDYIILYLAIYK